MTVALKPSPVENLATNLQRLMQQRVITEAELARRTKTPQPTLHKILTGKTEDPRCSTIRALADFFGLSIDELVRGNTDIPFIFPNTLIQSIPIISWQKCIDGVAALAEINPMNWDKWTVCETSSKSVYALLSRPSFEPRFPRGTILMVDFALTPKDGDIVVVHFPNSEEATLREFSQDGPNKLLYTLPNKTESQHLTNTIKILGVLIKSAFIFG